METTSWISICFDLGFLERFFLFVLLFVENFSRRDGLMLGLGFWPFNLAISSHLLKIEFHPFAAESVPKVQPLMG
jgi:hypothetical protein